MIAINNLHLLQHHNTLTSHIPMSIWLDSDPRSERFGQNKSFLILPSFRSTHTARVDGRRCVQAYGTYTHRHIFIARLAIIISILFPSTLAHFLHYSSSLFCSTLLCTIITSVCTIRTVCLLPSANSAICAFCVYLRYFHLDFDCAHTIFLLRNQQYFICVSLRFAEILISL